VIDLSTAPHAFSVIALDDDDAYLFPSAVMLFILSVSGLSDVLLPESFSIVL
jgi:hypothetical protein